MSVFNFLGPSPAYQSVWIIGDEFVTDNIGQYFQSEGEEQFYLREKYDVLPYYDNKFSLTTSVTARLHNSYIKAINEKGIFPKAVIFVLDGDILKMVSFNNYGISEIFGQILKNLMVGIHQVTLAFKENLPTKSKRVDYPTILWCLAPQHINFPENWNINRRKFNACIESLVTLFPEMGTLKMKKFWEYNNLQLFIDRRFTAVGLEIYCKSIDSTFWHWDTFMFGKPKRRLAMPNINHRKHKLQKKNEHRTSNDFVAMANDNYRKNLKMRKLPTPPRK